MESMIESRCSICVHGIVTKNMPTISSSVHLRHEFLIESACRIKILIHLINLRSELLNKSSCNSSCGIFETKNIKRMKMGD